jgi:ketose-bisphosphate aldolase
MLVHIKDIVKESQKKGYAIGAFNVHNMESILGVAEAAIEARSPAIIQVSEGAIKYMGLKPVTHLVSTVAKNVAAEVPIALHLDHGKSFDSVVQCISAGFTSVHIDASNLPLDENINITRQVVDMAHRQDVWVQGEVGAMIGGHGDITKRLGNIPIAEALDVALFSTETGVDTIAAAIGTAHGVHEDEDIIIDLLRDIKAKTKKPFVLHGGSGVSEKKIREAIKHGVDIINIGSDLKIAFSDALRKTCRENPDENDPRNLLMPSRKAVKQVAIHNMELFGSAGQIQVREVET